MSKEKQIESCENCLHYSACLINGEYFPTPCLAYEDKASYRKQSEGHWEKDEVGETLCSQCGVRPLYRKSGTTFATTFYPTRSNFCPHCGAKMKGGAE
jgi:hypothetical protein